MWLLSSLAWGRVGVDARRAVSGAGQRCQGRCRCLPDFISSISFARCISEINNTNDTPTMSFSKRSVPLSRTPRPAAQSPVSASNTVPGVRPSPITGQPTISTGCASLDSLLAANAGLVLGQSLLVEETGSTDYGSALLRCFAAEGVLQNHQVHVVGVGEAWGRDLPGAVEDRADSRKDKERPQSTTESERMKIAWRYERLGAHGERRKYWLFLHSIHVHKSSNQLYRVTILQTCTLTT